MKTRITMILAAMLSIVSASPGNQGTSEIASNSELAIADAELSIVLGENPGPAAQRVAEIFAARAKERSGIRMAASGDNAKVTLVIGKKEGSTPAGDGYSIVVDAAKRELRVTGGSDSGMVAGVGRLMREMRYQQGRLMVPALRMDDTPQMPNRGMYLWARKYYFAEPDKVDRYIEEFALWGGNALCFWFEMGMFDRLDDNRPQDPRAGYGNQRNDIPPQQWIAMYKRFYQTARRMGMKTGLLMVANDAYRTSPAELRVKPIIGTPNCYLCPSKPGAVEKMIGWQEEVFKALAPIDICNIFPADPGGCACDQCRPWPTHGFWKVARPLAERIHELSPKTEIWIDTWHLNHPTFGGKDWMNLVNNLASDKEHTEWFAGFEVGLAPNHDYARMSAEDRDCYNKAKQPLMVFPDISMWGNHRGMLVNKTYWQTLQDEMNSYGPGLMKGGWPYAERWNTDIACVMFLSWFWNPKKSMDQVLNEYAACYFGSEAANVRQLLELLDDSNKDPQSKEKIREMQAKLETTLPAWAKNDWRWNEIAASCRLKAR